MEELHTPQQGALQGDAAAAFGAEVALVDAEIVDARLQQGRRHPVGVGGGVGVDKAARVRGNGHVQGQSHLRRHLPQLPADLVYDLPAGRPGGVHTLVGPKALKGGVVVHRQINAVKIRLCGREKEAPGRDVHAHHKRRREPLRGPQLRRVYGVGLRHLRVAQQEGRLAQPPQGEAQGRRTAGGVAVRAAVGEDEELVLVPQQGCGGLRRQLAHVSSSNTMLSLAGLAGFTTSGSRSISRIWAPCWMESSAMNWSSGV